MSDTTGPLLERKGKEKIPLDMEYQKCEDRKMWTDWYYFNERETRARLQLGEYADGKFNYDINGACNARPTHGPPTDATALDVRLTSWYEGKQENANRPELGVSVIDEEERMFAGVDGESGDRIFWERAPAGLRPASTMTADDKLSRRDSLLVRRPSSAISSNSSSSFCDKSNNTTDRISPSFSSKTANRRSQRPNPYLHPLFFSDPDSVRLDDLINPSSTALDDPNIFDALLDACIEKTRTLLVAAEKALKSSSSPSSDADFGRQNGVFHDDDGGEERNDDGCEARLVDDNDGHGALGYDREVGRGRAEAAPRKEIVTVQGWWRVKDGEAAWREVGARG